MSDIYEILERSSATNRTISISFLLLLLYILITVVSTTDVQLLVPDSKVQLPIFDIDISLFGFFVFVPGLIIAFHFNVLFNLLQHKEKLHAWYENQVLLEQPNQTEKELLSNIEVKQKDGLKLNPIPPFLFNFLLCNVPRPFSCFLIRIVLWSTLFYLPLLLLLIIQWKFSAYHSLLMSTWHFLSILIDSILLVFYWHRIVIFESSINSENMNEIFDYHRNFGFLFFVKFINKRKEYTRHRNLDRINRTKLNLLGLSLFWVVLFFSAANYTILITLMINLITPINRQYYPGKSIKGNVYHFMIPHLEVVGKTLVTSLPNEVVIQHYVSKGKKREVDWIEFIQGLNLQNRDFRYANFRNSKFYNANLSGAKFIGSCLRGAQFQAADLRKAQLQKSDLLSSQFQGSLITSAQFQWADLTGAQFQAVNTVQKVLPHEWEEYTPIGFEGAELNWADFTGSRIHLARFLGADLSHTKFNAAEINRSDFSGSILVDAGFQGAELTSCIFQGTRFDKANLHGAILTFPSSMIGNWGKPDFSERTNWQEILDENLPNIPEKSWGVDLKADFSRIIETAKTCSEKFDSSYIQDMFLVDWDDHVEIRKQLACSEAHGFFARELIEQYEGHHYSNGDSLVKDLLDYLQETCPLVFQELQNLSRKSNTDYY